MATIPTPQGASESIPAYYAALNNDWIRDSVKNFDRIENWKGFEKRAKATDSRNFVLDFGEDNAWGLSDVRAEPFKLLLAHPRPPEFETRWIHIWAPHLQQETVSHIGRKYGFTPRLLGLMRSSLAHNRPKPREASPRRSFSSVRWGRSGSKPTSPIVDDTEKGNISNTSSEDAVTEQKDILEELNHYDVVDSIWHWSSVDLGKKYLCIGYNSLYNVKTSPDPEINPNPKPDLPNGKRVWNWLILCDDKTVISVVEGLSEKDAAVDISASRRNLLNVFRQMSKATEPWKQNPISLVPIRYSIGDDDDSIQQPSKHSSLLFFYLFDDWYSTYSLIAKHGNEYGSELNRLRENMMKSAHLSHVSQLHQIGRQLAILKRLYASYELIIDRVLETQNSDKSGGMRHLSVSSRGENQGNLQRIQSQGGLGQFDIILSPAAMNRFERLRDRIRLYILTEIQENKDLKDSLLMLNFNLITIKESNSIERLTRITILLAKVTILFLPISLVTGYFSVQIPNTGFTISAYWISFAVTLAISFLVLLVFGKISDTTEGAMVYRSINRVIFDMFKAMAGKSEKDKTG